MNLDFSDIKVLVVGDFMIDHYIIGESNRMSPEAPVPVVVPKEEYSIPGGAGNVAMNISTMGSQVTCLGAIGNDIFGEKLIKIFNENNVSSKHIEIIDNYSTTLKQRIYCNGIQVARVDKEELLNWNPNQSESSLDYSDYDIIILSDYDKGALIRPWFFKPKRTNVILDPKNESHEHLFMHSNIITPNLNELKKLSGMNINNNNSIINACNKLIEENNFEYIIAKKGDKGMTIVGEQNFIKHIEPHRVDNPDVTGAGDTVIAALSIAYAKTNDIEYSAKFANAAAAIAVSKAGTASVTIDEINNYIEISK
jgi:rfaE bifunctional protein kinase chain/domain